MSKEVEYEVFKKNSMMRGGAMKTRKYNKIKKILFLYI